MTPLKSVSIPNPCHESWNKMSAAADGRHCSSCCKTVTDFTKMNNDEIIGYLSMSGNICGRFSSLQLQSLNNGFNVKNQPIERYFKKWALALSFLGSIAFMESDAQVKQPTVQTTADTPKVEPYHSFALGKVYMAPPISQSIEINGKITDNQKQPLPGASISLKGNNISTTTNINGDYKLRIPSSGATIAVRLLGYQTKEIPVNTSEKLAYNVKLDEQSGMMGEIVIVSVKRPFFKGIYYRFIKTPFKKIMKMI